MGRSGRWASFTLAALLACGGAEVLPERPRAAFREGRGLLQRGTLASPPASVQDGPARSALPAGEPGLVVFVVLDTVRAQNLSLCGYGRETTKVLQTLVSKGAVSTCRAYAPATWTIPSHASFFTGQGIGEHDLHKKGLRLPEESQTLAEDFLARGYQTAMLSANPVLKETTGLQQGFLYTMVPVGLVSPMRGSEGLVAALRQVLQEADENKPLFLFINIFEAHDPYPAVPEGVPGIPAQDAFAYQLGNADDSNPWVRLQKGTLEGEERAAFLAHARDTYDYGVMASDRVLGRLLRTLEERGWTEHGVRMVVTSDHGEMLGEHGGMRHGQAPWEELARVPFLYYDTTGATLPTLPEPFPAIAAHALLRTGRLPDPLPQAMSLSMKYGTGEGGRFNDAAALWPSLDRKLFWMDGEAAAYDLAADPGELTPLPVEGPDIATLHQAVTIQQAAKERAAGQKVDAEAIRGLEALGYVGE